MTRLNGRSTVPAGFKRAFGHEVTIPGPDGKPEVIAAHEGWIGPPLQLEPERPKGPGPDASLTDRLAWERRKLAGGPIELPLRGLLDLLADVCARLDALAANDLEPSEVA